MNVLQMLVAVVASSVQGEPLWLVILVGGGLGLVGTLAGALVTQWNAARLAREARREARQLATNMYQRDVIVELQESLLELYEDLDALRRSSDSDKRLKIGAHFRATERQVRMLQTRVRDKAFREESVALLEAFLNWRDKIVPPGSVVPFDQREKKVTADELNRQVSEHAGELIRKFDKEIDDAL